MSHAEQHPLAGKAVRWGEKTYHIEDWWDRLTGGSWMNANGNPAAMTYGMRSGFDHLPVDDEVVYGHVGAFGHLVHVSELGDEVQA